MEKGTSHPRGSGLSFSDEEVEEQQMPIQYILPPATVCHGLDLCHNIFMGSAVAQW